MRVENALYPTTQQIEALRNDPSPSPVVMLNLLKFRTGRSIRMDARPILPVLRPTGSTPRRCARSSNVRVENFSLPVT